MRYIGCLFICLLWLFRATALFAVSNDQKPILIICSYNPAAHQTSVTISDYMEEYSKLGGKRDIIIENMTAKVSPSPALERYDDAILSKYQGGEASGAD